MEMLSKDRWKITEIINLEKKPLQVVLRDSVPSAQNPSLGGQVPPGTPTLSIDK